MSNSQHDWNDATKSLFQAARRVHDPSAADRMRVDAALASQLEAAEVAHVRTTSSEFGLRRLSAHSVLKLAIGAVCVAAALLAITLTNVRRAEPAPRAQLPVPAPSQADPPPATSAKQTFATPDVHVLTDAPETKPRAARRRVQAPGPQTTTRELKRPRTVLETAKRAQTAPDADIDHSPTAEAADALAPGRIAAGRSPDDAQPHAAASAAAARAQTAASPRPIPDAQFSRAAAPRKPTPDVARTELLLVADMHAALKRGDYSTALGVCAEHERHWPRGVFMLEREGVRAIAACGKRASEAGSLAQHFLVEHPNAPLAMRVRYACASQLPPR